MRTSEELDAFEALSDRSTILRHAVSRSSATRDLLLLNLGTWPALVEQGFRDPALIFVSGFPLFVAGLAIVRAHNRWEGSWTVLVTVVGWLALLSGLSRILFPTWLAPIAVEVVQSTGVLPAVAIVVLVVGQPSGEDAVRE